MVDKQISSPAAAHREAVGIGGDPNARKGSYMRGQTFTEGFAVFGCGIRSRSFEEVLIRPNFIA
jgi:hypothetical protein